MNATEAETLALLHMEEHGILGKFKFFFEDCKRTLGRCHYGSVKKISLSRWYVENNEEALVEDTILHEIAHALDYLERGYSSHDKHWKKICVRIGARPERCSKNADKPEGHYKYSVVCCGKTYGKHRKSRGRTYSCPQCRKRLKFVKNY
jgi:predicted SprT family Zn-dependent metalloprotease